MMVENTRRVKAAQQLLIINFYQKGLGRDNGLVYMGIEWSLILLPEAVV